MVAMKKMTKRECDRDPNYTWVKGSNGKRGHCRRKPRRSRSKSRRAPKRRRTRSRSRSRPMRRRTRSRSRTKYVYVQPSRPRTVYVRAPSPRRVYVKPASPRRVYVRPARRSPPRYLRRGPPGALACDIIQSAAVCRSTPPCTWDAANQSCS